MRIVCITAVLLSLSGITFAQTPSPVWSETSRKDFEDGLFQEVILTEKGEIRFGDPVQKLGDDQEIDPATIRFADPLVGGDANVHGTYVLCWVEEYKRVLAQVFDGNGAALTDTLLVNPEDSSDHVREFVDVATLNTGAFMVVWESLVSREVGYRTHVQAFNENGLRVADTFALPATPHQTTLDPVAFANENDQTFWVLQSVGTFADGRHIIIYRINSSGGVRPPAFYLTDPLRTNYERAHGVAFADDGSFMVTWSGSAEPISGFGDIYARRFNARGEAVGTPFKVNGDTGHTEQTHSAVQFDEAGNFLITWMDARRKRSSTSAEYDIYGQFYLSSGEKVGTNILINQALSREAYFPGIEYVDSTFAVSWIRDYRRPLYQNTWSLRLVYEGTYVSSVFDTGDVGTVYQTLSWEAETIEGTSAELQIRTARTLSALGDALWRGPEGAATYRANAGPIQISPVHNFDRFIQYRVILRREDIKTSPLLRSVSITFTAAAIPKVATLRPNYPNPFSSSTAFQFSTPEGGDVTLEVYDALGRKIETVFSGFKLPGNHEVVWTPQSTAAGPYFVVMRTSDAFLSQQFVRIK